MDGKNRMSAADNRAEGWQRLLREQEESPLSVRQFCAGKGLSLPQFYYWRRRLRTSEQTVAGPEGALCEDPGTAFVELDLRQARSPKSIAAALEICLDLGAGCTLTIRRG